MNREQAVSWTETTQSHCNPHLSQGHLCSFTVSWWEHAQPCKKGNASGTLERWQAGADNCCHQSSEPSLQHSPFGRSEVGGVSYFGSGRPFPGLLFPRISPPAPKKHWPPCPCTPLGRWWTAGKGQCCGTGTVVVGSFLLPVGWAVWGCGGQAPANATSWFNMFLQIPERRSQWLELLKVKSNTISGHL